jgi:hypothetical protein
MGLGGPEGDTMPETPTQPPDPSAKKPQSPAPQTKPEKPPSEKKRRYTRTGTLLSGIAGGLTMTGFVLIVIYAGATEGRHSRYAAVALVVAFGALGTGALLGFLFGIPKVVSSGDLRNAQAAKLEKVVANPTDAAGKPLARQTDETSRDQTASPQSSSGVGFTPSSNLAEVSDWLTKLLLGAGLVSLTQLGGPIGSLIRTVASGLESVPAGGEPSGISEVMAGGILVTYAVVGFLGGYLLTTLWYSKKLNEDAAG